MTVPTLLVSVLRNFQEIAIGPFMNMLSSPKDLERITRPTSSIHPADVQACAHEFANSWQRPGESARSVLNRLIPLTLIIQRDPNQFYISYYFEMLDIELRNEVKRAPELVFTHTRPKNLVEAGMLVERYERLLKEEKAERSQLHSHKHRASRGGHRSHQRRRSQRNPSCHSHSEAYHAPNRRGFVQVGSQPKNRLTDAERQSLKDENRCFLCKKEGCRIGNHKSRLRSS